MGWRAAHQPSGSMLAGEPDGVVGARDSLLPRLRRVPHCLRDGGVAESRAIEMQARTANNDTQWIAQDGMASPASGGGPGHLSSELVDRYPRSFSRRSRLIDEHAA